MDDSRTADDSAAEALALEPVYVHLGLTDPEVLDALKEYPAGPARNQFLELAIKIGVMSLKAAKGVVDADAVRNAGEKLLAQLAERLQGHRDLIDQAVAGTLREYFHPASGQFAARVSALTTDDGELAQLVRRQVGTEAEKLRTVLNTYIGEGGELARLLAPGEDNAFVGDLKRRMEAVLAEQSDVIVAQFSLDVETSALSRLVRELKQNHGDISQALQTAMKEVSREFSMDVPDSALSRLLGQVQAAQKQISDEFTLDREGSALKRLMDHVGSSIQTLQESQSEFQTQVMTVLSALQARKQAEQRSTTHGARFEEEVGNLARDDSQRAGDVLEDTGSTTGVIALCKVGDFVLTLGPDHAAAGTRIVIEAKEATNYSLKSTLEESDQARRNRAAQVALFVHSKKTAPAGLEPLGRYGNDIVVVWDAEDTTTDITVKAGLALARAMCVRVAQQSSKDAASWDAIDRAIEKMRKQIAKFADLKTSAESIERSAQKQLEIIRIASKSLEDALVDLNESLTGIRTDGAA